MTRSEGEARFARYLEHRELEEYEYEAPVGGRCPDFLVAHPLGKVACEVFEPVIRLPNQVAAFSSYPALRGGFEARNGKQAKAAKEAGIPFVARLCRNEQRHRYRSAALVRSDVRGHLRPIQCLDRLSRCRP
jgi:hypothetical protein